MNQRWVRGLPGGGWLDARPPSPSPSVPAPALSPPESSPPKRPSGRTLRSVLRQGTVHGNGESPTKMKNTARISEVACTHRCPAAVLLKGSLADLRYLGVVLKCGEAILCEKTFDIDLSGNQAYYTA